jgi:hypothetical protein
MWDLEFESKEYVHFSNIDIVNLNNDFKIKFSKNDF